MRRSAAVVMTLALGVAVVPAASARLPNACTLLSAAQIKAALQAKVQWRQRQGTGKYQMCTWHGEPYNASSYGAPTLTLTVAATTRARFKGAARMYGVPVSGVGELAYLEGGTARFLIVFGKGYSISVLVPQDDGGLKRAKAAAVAALSHL